MNPQAVSSLVNSGLSCRTVPVEHLDYSFIQNCSDVKHLEEILNVLRSGQEGFYPHLIDFCEKHIEKMEPKNGILRKENPPATAACFSTEEWNEIKNELQQWEENIRINEMKLNRSIILCDNVPAIRCSNTLQVDIRNEDRKQKMMSSVPRAYRDWDRFDVERECAKVDENDNNPPEVISHPAPSTIKHTLNSTGLMDQEKAALACREKDKGNESFRSGDYEEAVVYYTRSLSLVPSAAAYNNRAQAHIGLQRWSAALSDCQAVLQLEPENVKALLRRVTVHKHLGHWKESHDDVRSVLLKEPHNSIAQKLLMEITQESVLGNHHQKSRAVHKLCIRELEEEEEDNDTEVMQDCKVIRNTHTSLDSSRQTENNRQVSSETQFELLKKEGKDLVMNGLYQDAADKYSQCLQLKPQEDVIYTNRALCYLKLQRFKEAKQDCDSALQLKPTNKKAFYRRALANKGLEDYLACVSDLQQVLRLDAGVVDAEELLADVSLLLLEKKKRSPLEPRRSVPITEVEEHDEEKDSAPNRPRISLQACNAFEFGQALNAARANADLLTCAELLRSITSKRLPEYIRTHLDGHTISFIIKTLNTHLLRSNPDLVYEHLKHLLTTHRFSMVLMLLDSEDRRQLMEIFQKLSVIQTEAFSHHDVESLANRYL